MEDNKSFLTVKEVAERLRLNVITVYEFIKNGKLGAVKLGKNYRVAEEDLDVFIEKHKVKSATSG